MPLYSRECGETAGSGRLLTVLPDTNFFSRLILLTSTVLSTLGKASVSQNPSVNNHFTIIYKHLG